MSTFDVTQLKSFEKLYPMIIHKFETLLPTGDATILEKINSIITSLNEVGKLTNDVVKNWNTVMTWCLNDGLTTDVNNKFDVEVAKGTFDTILTTLYNTKMGDLTLLQTTDKTSVVNAINENTTHLAESAQQRQTKTVTRKSTKALFSYQFDGSYLHNYTDLLPAVEAKGVYVGLGAIVDQTVGATKVSSTDNATYFSISQLLDAVSRGHEVINHSWDAGQNMKPGTNVDANTLETWVNKSHEVWLAYGIETPIWITPNGGGVTDQTVHLDSKYISKILERHAVAQGRTDFPDINGTRIPSLTFGADTPLNTVGLVRCGTESYIDAGGIEQHNPDTQLTLLKQVVDYAIANKRCVIFHHHDINNGKFPLSYVQQLIDYVIAQGGEFVSNKDLYSSFSNVFDRGMYQKTITDHYKNTRYAVTENLLQSTNLSDFTATATATATLTESSAGRNLSSQYRVDLSGLANGLGVTYSSVIYRPFDTYEFGLLTASMGLQDTAQGSDLRYQLKIDAYASSDGTGTALYTDITPVASMTYVNGDRLLVEKPFRNYFTDAAVNSIKMSLIITSTGQSATGQVFVFNPQINRGAIKSRFIKTTLSSGVGTVSGTDNARVIKYDNGQMEIDMIVTLGSTPITTAWGSSFISGTISLGNFPVAFLSVPITSITVYNSQGSGVNLATSWLPTTTALPTIQLSRPTSATLSDLLVHVIAKGRWK